MALSKGLRLLARLDAPGEGSVLLEARGRGDCLLFEAGTVATLGECRPRRPAGQRHAPGGVRLCRDHGSPIGGGVPGGSGAAGVRVRPGA